MKLLSIQDLPLNGKRVFLRADLNVPLSNGTIIDDYRLKAILPTIDYLLKHQAKIILATHIGHPDAHAQTNFFDPELSTKLLVPWFKAHGYTIERERDLHTAQRKSFIDPGKILLLENLRFFNGETEHNSLFANLLANMADLYINDAFGLIHRHDCSITLLPELFSPEHRGVGCLIQHEIAELSQLKEQPQQPYLMVLGGKKIKDKIALLDNLLLLAPEQRPQKLLLGGAIANTFLSAQGLGMGKSLIDNTAIAFALEFLTKAQKSGVAIMLPSDLMITLSDGTTAPYPTNAIPRTGTAVDIGPNSIISYTKEIDQAQTIFANGTMGIYEQENAVTGTKTIFQAMANGDAHTVIGGGDAVAALHTFGLEDKIDFISTGGGATLAFLSHGEIEELPGLKIMKKP